MMKQQMKQQKQDSQQMKQKQRTQNSFVPNDKNSDMNPGYDDDSLDGEPGVDYARLIQEINFSAYEVPPHLGGKRIDAVLVELLNKESEGTLSISRSQCGTLLSSECVFVVPPEDAHEFSNARKAEGGTAFVPRGLIEEHSTPIQRKSHILEPSSVLIYPSRDSLLSTSSASTLLSNFISPSEIIAQKIPFLLHLRQLPLERQDFLVASDTGTRERLLPMGVELNPPAVELVGIHPDVPGDLRDAGTRLTGQPHSLALELLAVLLSLWHDTPPAS